MPKGVKIIVDTNFLIDIVRFKINLESLNEFGKYKLIIPKAVENELKKIKNKYARVAIELTKLKGMEIVDNPVGIKTTDEIIIALAKELKAAVATNDRKLRKRLKGLRIKTIYLRARKHLEIG